MHNFIEALIQVLHKLLIFIFLVVAFPMLKYMKVSTNAARIFGTRVGGSSSSTVDRSVVVGAKLGATAVAA